MKTMICEKKAGSRSDIANLLEAEGQTAAVDTCVVEAARSLMQEARRASCGACVYCREGTTQLHELLEDGTHGRSEPDDIELLAELAAMVRDNAGCELASKAAASVAALMDRYPEEFELHFKRGRCSALQCKAYYSVHILPEKCSGCGACRAVCPAEAIAGGEGLIHVIDGEKCDRCGACVSACEPLSNAIAKAGAVKPRAPDSPVPVGSWGEEGGGRRRRRRGLDTSEGSTDE